MKRLPTGGYIDRAHPLAFSYDARSLSGFAGDTLASALLGAGVAVIGMSVSLGRPRGIVSAGMEEATGFAQVTSGGASEPLLRMTALPLYDGLTAESRITKGYVTTAADDARFDKRFAHCDILVVGGGAAGLAAALVATAAGARVMLVEADTALGGALLRDGDIIDGRPSEEWVAGAAASLGAAADMTILMGATAAVAMDQNGMIVAQRVGALLAPAARGGLPEQRLWHVRARAIVLATGALERPIVFQDNDRPGIMLADAARAYLRRFALAPERGLVFTTNDDGYRTALDWHAAGVSVAGIVDPRPASAGDLPVRARAAGLRRFAGAVIETTSADATGCLRAARVRTPSGAIDVDCDLLAVSGGFEPSLALFQQLGGATRYDARLGAAVAVATRSGLWIAGAANGRLTTREALEDAVRAAREALRACGLGEQGHETPAAARLAEDAPANLWRVAAPDGDETRSFVDLHRDVSVAGIERAVGAGLRHIEHVKRYTLAGTGIEQGRSAKANAGAITAGLSERPVADVGTAGSRPPTEPLSFHLMAGRAKGAMYEPVRSTALHQEHVALGAVFEPAGQWLRPSRYPRAHESQRETLRRESLAVRAGVGIVDVSTLGKIDVRGPDATWFLDQLYANDVSRIAVGRARYSILCHLDGSLFDDGLVMRTGERRYFVTTSTGHAAAVTDWMEEWLQTEWPTRRVWVTPITEQFSTIAIVGPRSRALVKRLAPDFAVENAAFPFLAVRHAGVAGIADAQVARVSFSGELAYEVSVPWHLGAALWRATFALGADLGLSPYGLDTLQALRMEKGYIIIGQDTEALTTPNDAGLGWMLSTKKDFVGRRSLQRPALRRDDRLQLAGVVTHNQDADLNEGAALVRGPSASRQRIEGHVTSACWSATLGRSLGLALVRGGSKRHGETLYASFGDLAVAVTLVDPVHYDAAASRRDG
ncbi:MAG: glycine cleavage T C-terminal barrel domain-containing protein [Gemmatimonadaceae bacterium]